MRKVLGFTMIFTGTVISIIIFNILLYTIAPAYRNVLAEAVSEDEIPIVEASTEPVVIVKDDIKVQTTNETSADVNISEDYKNEEQVTEEKKTSDKEKELQIIDKEYHEDCGTGEGYWVITYSDGSVGLE